MLTCQGGWAEVRLFVEAACLPAGGDHWSLVSSGLLCLLLEAHQRLDALLANDQVSSITWAARCPLIVFLSLSYSACHLSFFPLSSFHQCNFSSNLKKVCLDANYLAL